MMSGQNDKIFRYFVSLQVKTLLLITFRLLLFIMSIPENKFHLDFIIIQRSLHREFCATDPGTYHRIFSQLILCKCCANYSLEQQS